MRIDKDEFQAQELLKSLSKICPVFIEHPLCTALSKQLSMALAFGARFVNRCRKPRHKIAQLPIDEIILRGTIIEDSNCNQIYSRR